MFAGQLQRICTGIGGVTGALSRIESRLPIRL
jgi:hypothetical protein